MDEAFILQTVGRLYLENVQLQNLLRALPDRSAEVAELRRQIDALTGTATNEPNREN